MFHRQALDVYFISRRRGAGLLEQRNNMVWQVITGIFAEVRHGELAVHAKRCNGNSVKEEASNGEDSELGG